MRMVNSLKSSMFQRSDYIRYSWLLSKEVSESIEIEQFKNRILYLNGKREKIFGGVLVVNLPFGIEYNVIEEINRLVNK
jgi:hypothetical protein